MNSFVKLLIIMLTWQGQGSTADFFATNSATENFNCVSNTFPTISTALSQNIKSFGDAISKLDFSFILNCLRVTENGVLDFNTLENKLNLGLSVNLTSILNALNIIIARDGTIDLKSLAQNFNLANVDWTSLLLSMDINIIGGMLDFTNLAQKITASGSLINYLNTFALGSTEDADCSFPLLAQKYISTKIEEYDVPTADGYIIKLYRIPSKNNCKVALLSHGVLGTATDWLLRGDTSLVYFLVQNDYDTWAINYRGTTHSRRHLFLNPNTDSKFWDFSMQELGYNDLCAVIDFILKVTGRSTLSIVGHSEGTSTEFVALSTRPDYNKYVDVFVACSPVIGFPDCGFALKALMTSGPVINELLLAFNIHELLAHDSLPGKLIQFCGVGPGAYDLCVRVLLAGLVGYSPDNMEPEYAKKYFKCWPGGTSRKNLEHFYQVDYARQFVKFDYKSRNKEVYGTDYPPAYDLKKMTCKVALMLGRNDKIVGVVGGKAVRDLLPNVVDFFEADYDPFNHIDFTGGKNAHQVLYPHLIEILDKYSNDVCKITANP